MSKKLSPFVKWAGGKTSELDIIKEYMPEFKGRYIEPFVGGGAVFFAIGEDKNKVINDKSTELINLYQSIKRDDKDFFATLDTFNKSWNDIEKYSEYNQNALGDIYKEYERSDIDLDELEVNINKYVNNNSEDLLLLLHDFQKSSSDFFLNEIRKTFKRKYKRLKDISLKVGEMSDELILDNIEVSLKSSYYMFIRHIYNNMNNLEIKNGEKSSVFYFIREYCYSSMFRYNKKGEFNVPYGGISYNKKEIKTKADMIKNNNYSEYLSNTEIHSLDFEKFFEEINLIEDDFIFLDPPYDSEFSSYANMEFNREDQERLADILKDTEAKWMIVIKNTDFIYELYKDYNIVMFGKNYSVNFHNRNDREVEHLLIKNY